MQIQPRLVTQPIAAVVAVLLGGCAVVSDKVPELGPIVVPNSPLASSGPRLVSGEVPVPVGRGVVAFPIDPKLVGGIGNAADIAVASARSIARIPGVDVEWQEIKDLPIERRSDFLLRLDTTLRQLQSAEIEARVSAAKPGMEVAHAQTVKSLQDAVTELNRQRAFMEVTTPERWDNVKEDFHESWLDTQSAYVRAKATGN